MKRDLYAEVSTRIVAELERGAAPWIKPWSATAGQNVPQWLQYQSSRQRPRHSGGEVRVVELLEKEESFTPLGFGNAGYIATWIDLLKADGRAFFTACRKAQNAADYLRDLALAEPATIAA
jgi:antirestriction protein ArdC